MARYTNFVILILCISVVVKSEIGLRCHRYGLCSAIPMPSGGCCPFTCSDLNVVLCEHRSFAGKCKIYDMSSSKCTNIDDFADKASSLTTLGGCFVAFVHINCAGDAFIFSSTNYNNLANTEVNMNDVISSIRQCHADDFH